VRLCGISAALGETRILVSSSEMSARSSITFTSIPTERLFAHIGSNTRLLTASQASDAIQTQRTMAVSHGLSSSQWTAGGSETSQESSNFTALPATHDTHDMHDFSFTDKIDKAEPIRLNSRFKTSSTAGFQHTGLLIRDYITNRIKIIDDGLGVLSDQAINLIRAKEDVQLEISGANLSESLEQAEKFAKICNLNESMATEVKHLEATEPVRDGPSRESAAAQREIEEFEEELQIEKHRSAKLERRLDECMSVPETTEQTDIAQLHLEKDMQMHRVKNLSSKESSLQSELRVFEHVIQRLTTNQVHATQVQNTSHRPQANSVSMAPLNRPLAHSESVAPPCQPLARLEAVASLSSHLTF